MTCVWTETRTRTAERSLHLPKTRHAGARWEPVLFVLRPRAPPRLPGRPWRSELVLPLGSACPRDRDRVGWPQFLQAASGSWAPAGAIGRGYTEVTRPELPTARAPAAPRCAADTWGHSGTSREGRRLERSRRPAAEASASQAVGLAPLTVGVLGGLPPRGDELEVEAGRDGNGLSVTAPQSFGPVAGDAVGRFPGLLTAEALLWVTVLLSFIPQQLSRCVVILSACRALGTSPSKSGAAPIGGNKSPGQLRELPPRPQGGRDEIHRKQRPEGKACLRP